jgi:hypothetical protein
MLTLLIQITGAILTAFIALVLLKKDPRTATQAIRKESVLVKNVIIAVTVVSMINLSISFYIARSEKAGLENDRRALKADNDELRSQISRSNLEQEQLISYQKQSARQLTQAANNLQHLLSSSSQAPLFHFMLVGNKTLIGTVVNKDYKPVYNLSVRITNYDNLLQCRPKKAGASLAYAHCYVNNTLYIPTISTLNAQSTYYLKLPRLDVKAKTGRFIISLTVNKRTYYEQAVYSVSKKKVLSQALRLIEYNDNTIIHKAVISNKDYRLTYINWTKSFPLPLSSYLPTIRNVVN